MNLMFDKPIEKKQLNLFIFISFFFIFITFVISKGFIKNEELSDKLFLFFCILSIELSYLIFSNKIVNFRIINLKDHLILFIFFALIFAIWNYETIFSYIDIFLFFVFHLFLIIPIITFINSRNIANFSYNSFLLIGFLSLILSGLFYQINYSALNFFLIILVLSLLTLILNFISKKSYKWIDILLSILIFLILIKVFLISSPKDAFHYSWFLGPINSLDSDYSLLNEVASQYGYLNILIIHKLSQLTKIDSSYVLVIFIISLFTIFYFIFFHKIFRIIKVPITILTIFLSFLIFGNIGFYNFSGSMLIPSSSVFRFLPSLLTVIFFSNILDNKNPDNLKRLVPFYLSLFISLIWSFESAFFVIFSLGSFFFISFILNLNSLFKNKSFFSSFYNFKFSLILGLILLFILFFLFKDKDISLFYEHALNTNASLSEEIINNKTTLFFIFLLLLCYLILRDSFIIKKIFVHNILWFALFLSFSAYFLLRSVDSNIFNILPFILFITCSMKTNSNQIEILRKTTLFVVIFFSITSSILSTIINKEIFYKKLLDTNTLILPTFLNKDYKPHPKILDSINNFKDLPLTIISGKTIHNKNVNLQSGGYGLPILPLEHFNILNFTKKQKLFDKFFIKNHKHLILCINKCNFYYSNIDNDIRNKIFLGKNVELKKVIESKTYNKNEVLYLLSKI